MPQKRGEVVEDVGSSQMIPDVYETWLKKQVKARSDLMGVQESKLAEETEEDKEELKIDRAEDRHEKAHRRKRAKGSSA